MEVNPAQNEVINHTNGPLLIIAGAGTGKTRAITSRIVHLIHSKQALPHEILALTFTDKAANEMLCRVDENMPFSYEEICITTFHSFAEKILRESGAEIGIDFGFKILNKVKQWFFFKENLYSFKLDYYRPLGNPNKFIYSLISHFNKLKDELISPDQYINYAKKLKGEEKTKMLEVANAYKTYQKFLIKNNYLDFGDLLYYAVELFKRRKSVLKDYQNRFKHILVDEFQDTNYAQYELVTLLASEHKNIIVVGDDDQSIYKWRGASLSNILKFQKKFFKHKKILLTDNYRSTKNILDGAHHLIQNNNPDRLEYKTGLSKRLNCHNKNNDPVEIHHFNNYLQEASFAAEKIKYLQKNENASFNDFAVLVRSNSLANSFVDEFKYLGIPYQVRNPKGLLSLEEIKDLAAIIRFLSDPYDDVALLRILKMDVFGISMEEILRLLGDGKEDLYFNIKFSKNDSIKNLYLLLNNLIEFSKKNTVGIVLNEFLQKFGYLKYLIENEKYEELDNINEFAKQVYMFEKETENKTVLDFASYLDLLEEADAALDYEEFSQRDSVQILTTHGAKGLEFKYVFIVNAVNGRFPHSDKREIFEIPEELTNEIYPEGDYHMQEERRLFYVAMTRTKNKLFITYSEQYEGPKQWKISCFAKEVLESGKAIQIEHKQTENLLKKLKTYKKPVKSIFNLPPFKSNTLSHTQLDTFKICPLQYNYRYIMHIPQPSSHITNFGTSIHNTLKETYYLIQKDKKVDFKILADLYEKNWIPDGYENKQQQSVKKKKGLQMLRNFYNKNSKPWIVPAFLERRFNLKIGNYIITGRIDRIDKLQDGTYEVIDYKTGRVKKDFKNNFKIDKEMQLSIYALACREVFKIPVSKLSFYFLEDNIQISTKKTDAQIDMLCDEILKTINDIKESDFSPHPTILCKFCDYRLLCPAV